MIPNALPAPQSGGLIERGLTGDPMLRIELEAEKACHRDHDRGSQAHQDLYHSVNSGWRLCRGQFVILSVE